jgi:hypothetical protein
MARMKRKTTYKATLLFYVNLAEIYDIWKYENRESLKYVGYMYLKKTKLR